MTTSSTDTVFVGTSELAALMRRQEWRRTPIGPPARWPQSVRAIIRTMLTSRYAMWMGWGPELRFFYDDGPSALLAADRFRPDVALLDIGLPVMDGFELAGQMRRLPELQRLRLVAVTGYGQEHDRVRAADAGCDAHLVKRVHVEQLAPLLQQLARPSD